jgi:hypothetical protein
VITRVRHWWLALITLPGLIVSPHRRALLREMRGFVRNLPTALQAPLPTALQLTPASSSSSESERTIRDLADLAALLDRRSPLGLCLRRSLTRYHFLRRAGVPVALQFGAKFKDGKPDREISGHAWLTLDGRIYHEDGENWRGFTVMLSFPQPDVKTSMEE